MNRQLAARNNIAGATSAAEAFGLAGGIIVAVARVAMERVVAGVTVAWDSGQ